MGRLADVLHIGFTVTPDWDLLEPLHPSNIQIETITSRQVQQVEGWDAIVSKI